MFFKKKEKIKKLTTSDDEYQECFGVTKNIITRTSAYPPPPKPRNKKENTLKNEYVTTEEYLKECSEEDLLKIIDNAKNIWDETFNKQEDEIVNSDEETQSASEQQLLDAIRLVCKNGEVYKRKS